tara:strand:- start:2893 stop:3735 length:843 start_codon:yes stop_codon:yes gene_type:complete
MNFNLAAMTRRAKNPRRDSIPIRDIRIPATQASNLYQRTYRRIVETWEAAVPSIVAQYERDMSALTTDTASDAIEDVDRGILGLILQLRPELTDWAIRLESLVRQKWTANVLSATSVDLTTMLGPEDVRQTVQQAIDWNTNLIKDVSAQTRQRVGNAVFDGLRNRTPARDVAKAIREATGMARRRSLNIAAHQSSSLAGQLAQERRRQAGLSVFMWIHSGKTNYRPEHKARDGVMYSEDPAMVGKVVRGQTVRAAPQSSDRASIPPWCGCRERAVLVLGD